MKAMPKFSDRPSALAAAAAMLKKLSHPNRLAILCRLVEGDASVAELENELGLRQPGLSQQLAELRNVGMIAPHRNAKSVTYHVVDENVAALVTTLHRMYCGDDLRLRHPSPLQAKTVGARAPAKLLGAAVFAVVQPQTA